MGRNWEEGELFVWGDDGLVPADSQEKAVRPAAEPARALPFETPPVRRSEEPAVRRVGRSSGLGEIVTGVDEASGIVRTAASIQAFIRAVSASASAVGKFSQASPISTT